MDNLTKLTLIECMNGLNSGKFSSVELTNSYIKNIEANRALNAYVLDTFQTALDAAKTADSNRAAGKSKVLEGIPLGVKDLYCTKGVRTTACSKALENFVPPYESTVTERLFSQGMHMLGKLNMDEFAMGATNTTSVFGAVRNPHDQERISGGSSGGSVCAVAAGLAPAALGSETGDSVRAPAAMCGVTGFKPSYGRCSRYGMIGYSSSMDQAGTITKTVGDAAILLNYMAGYDEKDAVCSRKAVPDYTKSLKSNIKGLKIGLVKEFSGIRLEAGIAKGYESCIELLKKAGAEIKEVSIPHAKFAGNTYTVLANSEASSNLARFDGVRYGYRNSNERSLDGMYACTRGDAFGWQIKRRLVIGAYMLSGEQYEKYFIQAQKMRRLIFDDMNEVFKDVDVVFAPVIPDKPPKIDEIIQNKNFSQYNEAIDLLNLPMSIAGLPAIAIPAGRSQGMPFGVQFAAKRFNEETVFWAGHAIEQLLKN